MAEKNGFRTVPVTDDETEQKIRAHKQEKRKIAAYILVGLVLAFLVVELVFALGSYDSYSVRTTTSISESSTATFAGFHKYILEYSNDGIVCMDVEGNLRWNQSFDMVNPKIDICGDYLVAYDQGGTGIYILTEDGLQKSLEMVMPIRRVCIAEQGTIAVLLKEGNNSFVRLYDKNGGELAGGQFYASEGSLPVDIALSNDAKKLAMAMIDITGGKVDSMVSFYNFGSVGKNEIDNNVGSFLYEDTLIATLEFMGSDCLMAVGSNEIIFFEGTQKPQPKNRITYEKEIDSIFYNEKYVGVVYANGDENNSYKIKVFDTKGKPVMEHETQIQYKDISLLSNNEICVRGEFDCELFTIHSIQKFTYSFEEKLYGMIYGGSGNNYIVMKSGSIERIHLH